MTATLIAQLQPTEWLLIEDGVYRGYTKDPSFATWMQSRPDFKGSVGVIGIEEKLEIDKQGAV